MPDATLGGWNGQSYLLGCGLEVLRFELFRERSQNAFNSRGSLAWPVATFEVEEGSSLMTHSMCCWSNSLMAIAIG